MNIFLDIDDVIFDWHESYCKRFNAKKPKRWMAYNETIKTRLELLRKEKKFWLELPIKNIPNFQPKGFVSARSIPKSWTVASLKINNIPGRSNVHQVPWNQSKIEKLKELNCTVFIDDKIETFKECHANGIFCLLMDASHNQYLKTDYRIYDLDINNILELWQKLK